MQRPIRTKRNAKDWRLDVQDAERPVDADAFLRRLTEVLLDVGRRPDADPPKD